MKELIMKSSGSLLHLGRWEQDLSKVLAVPALHLPSTTLPPPYSSSFFLSRSSISSPPPNPPTLSVPPPAPPPHLCSDPLLTNFIKFPSMNGDDVYLINYNAETIQLYNPNF